MIFWNEKDALSNCNPIFASILELSTQFQLTKKPPQPTQTLSKPTQDSKKSTASIFHYVFFNVLCSRTYLSQKREVSVSAMKGCGAILGYQIPPKIWNFQDLILLNPRFQKPLKSPKWHLFDGFFFSVVLPLSTMATMKLNSRANLDPKKLRIFELAYGQDSDDDDSCASAWSLVSQIPHKNRHSSQKTPPWSFARNLHVTPLKKD